MKRTIVAIIICCLLMGVGCRKETIVVNEGMPKIICTERVHESYYDGWNDYYPSGTDIVAHFSDESIVLFTIDDERLHECTFNGNRFVYNNQGEYPLTIPDSIIAHTFFGEFHDCYFTVVGVSGEFDRRITSITLPITVSRIDETFSGCSSLTTCTCYAVVPPTLHCWYGEVLLFESTPIKTIYVPSESVEDYKTADGWAHYADIIYPIE